ncbi:hypothetical protein E8E15_000821 [Penicillium rubens]|jgi:hypothetical protein|uniref:Pc18g03040 protein n=1 Tax=Penicillium rubens (strain ATCC 28089 / DSM 1075 / NRRL 1951 / Wisconsin 54-1255) TaxID=500485 RepID=B6HB72_PENRW|nr:uncharacterized protein N7525_000690 [Penicillium rubens]KAF3020328.1 hypothetical protein E8E15_000821 [Penicillium rubens]KAJ5842949.1 hypothetical protein N7525_000690 [Penicillium rubens]KAJ5846470.1 hypothetical protein N7534_010139 [Penicillium rubens]CAP94528.1 Pc18g03040 [Penicillium rubens Wisconsin 54-1255]
MSGGAFQEVSYLRFFVLITKTLLLQSTTDGIYDQVSLPILLSDSIATLDTYMPEFNRPPLLVKSAALAEWSVCQLCPLAVNASGISTAQTLLRLIWHHLRRYQARLATSYIQPAAQIINDLRNCLSTAPNSGDHTPLKVFMEHDCSYQQEHWSSIGNRLSAKRDL